MDLTFIEGSHTLIDLANQACGQVFDIIATLVALLPAGTGGSYKLSSRSWMQPYTAHGGWAHTFRIEGKSMNEASCMEM
eukprot:1161177-Pelagomonas_calceolata.AAC.4